MVDTGTKSEASSHSVNSDVSGKPSENSDFADLMSGTPATATGNKCMDKNSILALYGQASKLKDSNLTINSLNLNEIFMMDLDIIKEIKISIF